MSGHNGIPAGWKRTSSHSIGRGPFSITKNGRPPDTKYLLFKVNHIFGPYTELDAAVKAAEEMEATA